MKAIQTYDLTKYYGDVRGIDGVSLCVDTGEFFGFIGPNGAGKSTLIRTLLGLISPTSGRAEIFGRDIVDGKLDNLREIGYLPAEVEFYNGMKVRDVLRFAAKMRGLNCDEEAKALCERLDLDVNRKVSELSLGNRKKVGIVCALPCNVKHFDRDVNAGHIISALAKLKGHTSCAASKVKNKLGTCIRVCLHGRLDEVCPGGVVYLLVYFIVNWGNKIIYHSIFPRF